jgi:biopolymer transport protein ExbD
MAIKTRNKRSTEFSSASMSDLVFLLLIFFMLTSTLVSPNAIKLLLPSSSSDRNISDNRVLTVYIDESLNYYIGENMIDMSELGDLISRELIGQKEATVVLRSDATVPVQNVVYVIDAVNNINKKMETLHKVILATNPM